MDISDNLIPKFLPGKNIAIKVPPHQFEQTVKFYRDILKLKELNPASSDNMQSVTFQFGDKNLWIDNISTISQAEIWLEIRTDNIEKASLYLKEQNITRQDEIEKLPEGFAGFWISSPSNIIHLVNE